MPDLVDWLLQKDFLDWSRCKSVEHDPNRFSDPIWQRNILLQCEPTVPTMMIDGTILYLPWKFNVDVNSFSMFVNCTLTDVSGHVLVDALVAAWIVGP